MNAIDTATTHEPDADAHERDAARIYDQILGHVTHMYARRPHLICLGRTGALDGAWRPADGIRDDYQQIRPDEASTWYDADLLKRLVAAYAAHPGADPDLLTRNSRFPRAVELYTA